MNEKALFSAIRSTLISGFTALNLVAPQIKQSYQPRQQGTPTGPVLFMQLIAQHRYGSMGRNYEWIPPVPPETEGREVRTETQIFEAMFQISALSPQDPADDAQLTAGDLANYAAYILQSDTGMAQLLASGIGIERITDVRNPKFDDDRDQFEASPSFDFVLTHKQIVTSEVPVLQSTEFLMKQV